MYCNRFFSYRWSWDHALALRGHAENSGLETLNIYATELSCSPLYGSPVLHADSLLSELPGKPQ